MGKSTEQIGSWLETFEKATKDTVLNGELRVPKKRTQENIALVKEQVEILKKKLDAGIDRYVDYLDDGRQWRQQVAYNEQSYKAIKLLDSKLEQWLNGEEK